MRWIPWCLIVISVAAVLLLGLSYTGQAICPPGEVATYQISPGGIGYRACLPPPRIDQIPRVPRTGNRTLISRGYRSGEVVYLRLSSLGGIIGG